VTRSESYGSLAVVMPAYHAALTVGKVVESVRCIVPDAVVIVVDDGSRDTTAECARTAGATVVGHARNEGKGRALALGMQEALTRPETRVVVTMDADGQHPPEEIPRLIAPLDGNFDLVVGARDRDPGVMPFGRRCTNWLSSTLVSRITGVPVPDSQSGFRAMTRAVAAAVRPSGARYEFETEFLLAAAEAGFRIGAVPIPVVYEGAPSHFRYVADTMRLSRVFLGRWRQIVSPHP
jgi:hypothetical protein